MVHESDSYCYSKNRSVGVHESDVIVTVRKECWWYMNQMYLILVPERTVGGT